MVGHTFHVLQNLTTNFDSDRGGTFTDVCAHVPGPKPHDVVLKLLSVDPANYPDAPSEGIRRILEQVTGKKSPKGEPIDLSPVESIRMGTTVATNALLERKGDRVAFLVTKGFGDILRIGQQARPAIFDLSVTKLQTLYEQVYEIDERVTLEGYSENPLPEKFDVDGDNELEVGTSGEVIRVLRKPDESKIKKLLQDIWQTGVRSLALSLMHSYIYPKHEQIIASLAREIGFDISVSSDIQPMVSYPHMKLFLFLTLNRLKLCLEPTLLLLMPTCLLLLLATFKILASSSRVA